MGRQRELFALVVGGYRRLSHFDSSRTVARPWRRTETIALVSQQDDMTLDLKSRVKPIVERLLAEGQAVLKTKFHKASDSIVDQKNDGWVDPHDLEKWLAGCRNIIHMIGPKATTWNSQFANKGAATDSHGELTNMPAQSKENTPLAAATARRRQCRLQRNRRGLWFSRRT